MIEPKPTPRMFYFGPWDRPGHHLFFSNGTDAWRLEMAHPFRLIDGVIQPGCATKGWRQFPDVQNEGEALLRHKDGWTALSFWDRSVDTRGGCNSTYIAEGTFAFDEMVAMAKGRFAYRWNKMKFTVRLAEPPEEKTT